MIDPQHLKHNLDLRELVTRYSELKRESSKEMSGPCPRCGGQDRFHVTSEWFFCRSCHEKRGDAIEFMCWLHGVSFQAACAILADGTLSEAPATSRPSQPTVFAVPSWRTEAWQRRATQQVTESQHLLQTQLAGEPGRAYLSGRGLKPQSWRAFRLGFDRAVSLPGTAGQQTSPAICIPWYRDHKLCAVRFRFLTLQEYRDAQGQQRCTKQTALAGSGFAGGVYGGQALLGCAEAYRTLILCEGEFNAISIWQVHHEAALDVLSFGSDGAKLTHALIAYAKRYSQVIIWADRPATTDHLMQAIPGACGVHAPDVDGHAADANDLLCRGWLGEFLTTLRHMACQSSQEQEKLIWDLWDAAQLVQGVATEVSENTIVRKDPSCLLNEHEPENTSERHAPAFGGKQSTDVFSLKSSIPHQPDDKNTG